MKNKKFEVYYTSKNKTSTIIVSAGGKDKARDMAIKNITKSKKLKEEDFTINSVTQIVDRANMEDTF